MADDGASVRAPAPVSPPVVRLQKTEGWPGFGFADLWRDRELLWFLTQRDLKVRYKQTFFGAAWAIAQPLVTMLVFTVVFGRIADLPSEHLPYSVFVLGGLVPWGLVASGVPSTSVSLLSNVPLITKVRIHNMLVPAGTVLASLVDLAIAIALLVVFAGAHGIWPGPEIVALPLFVALDIAIVFGVGLLLSSINVLYRDIRYAVPFGVQVWLFLTPVVYPAGEVSSSLRWLFALNPMAGVIEGFRWSVLGTGDQLADVLPASIVGAAILLLGGAYVFRRIEPSFADVV
jgi:lipopolysaccharide transport system permease protein